MIAVWIMLPKQMNFDSVNDAFIKMIYGFHKSNEKRKLF